MRGFMGQLTKRGLSKRSIARALAAVRGLYRYLATNEMVDGNPARAVGTPKAERHLPGYLDRTQIDLLFQSVEVHAASGRFIDVRNAAILELFYSTGMRLSELQGLNRRDIDPVSQQVKVRGKGRKERIIPMGNHATLALRNYERKRDELATPLRGALDKTAVFVGRTGRRMSTRAVQKLVSGSAPTACDIPSQRTCSMQEPIFEPCRNCWGTRRSRRPRSIPIPASSA